MENWAYFSVVVTALAVILQAGVMVALYLSVKKTSARVESLASDVQKHALPVLDSAQAILTDSKEKIALITENLASASTSLRKQVQRVDMTMEETLDRTRLQVIRVDELVTRTMDRVEETTELVQSAIIVPVRQLAGLVQGLTVGVNTFFRRRKPQPRPENATLDEEMFI